MLKLHRLVPPALLVVLASGGSLWAEEPLKLPTVNDNQRVASAVATELQHSGLLKDYRVDVSVANGNVELSGEVANAQQRDAAIRMAQNVAGVAAVKSKLQVRDNSPVVHAQFGTLAQADPAQKPAETLTNPTPVPGEGHEATTNDPVPSFRALPGQAVQGFGPGAGMAAPMPPHAWPTFAPYNNYSRVAYPVAYPQNAFPYIGPVYPFPKVPLGWRKVLLEWDDGHWWLSTHAQRKDWWTLRYW
jgi:hypothetical protein